MNLSAPYMRWAKTRPRVSYDLASSGLRPVTTEELLGSLAAKDAFEMSGPNDEGFMPLRQAIGGRYGMPTECVTIAAGASGANFLTCLALLQPGDDALIEMPVYDPLMAAARAAGARVVPFARRWDDGFALDPEAVRRSMTPATKLIILTNAHNPSGAMVSSAALDELGAIAAKAGAIVMVDEVYAEAQYRDDPPPVPAARRGDPFVTTNSLTKAYGLAGLRCGWILAAPHLSQRIREIRDAVDGSGPFVAERLSLTAFDNLDRLRARARQILSRNVSVVREMAVGHPRLEWLAPAAGTTAFPRVVGVDDTRALVDTLIRDHDTVVVPGHFFQSPQHIRISFGGDGAMVIEALVRLGMALRG